MKNTIIIYCDGACSNNQKKENVGGWGVVLKYNDRTKEIYGGEKNTTNQRMEITACIKALEALKTNVIPIQIYSDSAYLIDCMNKNWYKKWEINGWKTTNKKPVENQDLWVRLIDLINQFKSVKFVKVKGHAGNELNEVADKLAKMGIKETINQEVI